MRRSTLALALAALFGASAGCGAQTDMGMSGQMDELGLYADFLETETGLHARAAERVADMAELMAVEAPHYERAMGYVDDMDDKMADLAGCRDGADHGPALAALAADVAAMREAGDQHASTLMGISDVLLARAEEMRHADAMGGLFAGMRAHMGAMSGQTGRFSCHPMHPMMRR